MQRCHNGLWIIALCSCLFLVNPAEAGTTCSWLGIGCENSDTFDQDNPPEVFEFTASGSFDKWTDIAPEQFVCDTREREDRSCRWRGYIPEIKRNVVVVFEPFPHDLGMYKVRALISHNLGRDLDYGADVGVYISLPEYKIEKMLAYRKQVSITEMAQHPLGVEIRTSNYRGEVDYDEPPLGTVELQFKGVLK